MRNKLEDEVIWMLNNHKRMNKKEHVQWEPILPITRATHERIESKPFRNTFGRYAGS